MTADETTASITGRFVTTTDITHPNFRHHSPPITGSAHSIASATLKDSDEWFKTVLFTSDMNTEGTRSWIETALTQSENVFLVVADDSQARRGLRLRKVVHRWLSSSETDLNRLSNPWWTSFEVYKCDGWLEKHDIIEVMLTDDLEGEWNDIEQMS